MQTTDKATTKQRTQWQDSEAQHALTTALDKNKYKTHKLLRHLTGSLKATHYSYLKSLP